MVDGVAASTPAGRLREVLTTFRGGGSATLSQRWQRVADELAADIDGVSARAEAAALLREVELAASALPEDDDPLELLEARDTWARPIFGIGVNDLSQINPHEIMDEAGLLALGNLHRILRRDAPEFEIQANVDQLTRTLEGVENNLESLEADLERLRGAVPSFVHARLLVILRRARDDVRFVRFRGYGALFDDLRTSENDLEDLAGRDEVKHSPDVFEAVNKTLNGVKTSIKSLVEIVVPAAAAISYGTHTGDIPGAINLYAVTSHAIEAGKEPPALPRGNGEDPV